MKVLGTFYTPMSCQQLAAHIWVGDGAVQCIAEQHCIITAPGLRLTLEGCGDILLEGQFGRPIAELDNWFAHLQTLSISCAIDVHGDAARLLRRHMQ
ncbi:MAG: hypothetical protein ACPG4U_07560 [Pseudomonadales bacterium]